MNHQPGSPTIKVLHLADPHWDPEYLEGSNANCDSPLCCRADSGPVEKSEDAAGFWGDYRKCDMPWRTIENSLEQMAEIHSVWYYKYLNENFNLKLNRIK